MVGRLGAKHNAPPLEGAYTTSKKGGLMLKQLSGVHTFVVGNVAEALYLTIQSLKESGIEVETRNGSAKEFPMPVAITYNKPLERVIYYPERDANPVFHFMESLWMLNGNNDLQSIEYFNKRMRDFSDDGEWLHGAYGHRWRRHFVIDQLQIIIRRLKSIPNDRRSVLTMWDPHADLLEHNARKDLPCNTHVYFTIRNKKLHMTVCNRSNDLIWGCCGANAVHMSYLQEYVATMVGVEVGTYTQFTQNLHAYNSVLKTLVDMQPDYDSYDVRGFEYQAPLINDKDLFDYELQAFMDGSTNRDFRNNIFTEVALPMFWLWEAWKSKNHMECMTAISQIQSDDWRLACREWIDRRSDKLK